MSLISKIKSKLNNLNAKNEFLSGSTVALALIPEAIAFSIIANVSHWLGFIQLL
ncbi:MAG: hypothetical protein Q8M06_06110 [Methanobacteriaceae archaeon]|nr:hypothetical protein [Methanobacteriaceae archaeon]